MATQSIIGTNNPPASVLITSDLYGRRPVPHDAERVNRSLRELGALVVAGDVGALLRRLVQVAVDVCEAHSSGLSVLERTDAGVQFRWDAMAGRYENYVGGTTPREWSPCGVTLDRKSPQLFREPAKFFTYFEAAQPPIVEGLVLPLFLDRGQPYGTLWIVSHDEERKFNSEDVRVMQSLCGFATAAARVLNIRPRL